MGRWKAWALAWLLAATLSALLLQVPSARGDELLVNGGFEDGVEDGWVYRHCVATPVASPLRPETTGSQAIELAGEPSSSLEFYLEMYQDLPVVVGEEYVFSGYYAVRDGAGIEELRLRVIWWYWDGGTMVQVDPVPDDAAANILHDSSYHLLDIGPRVARPNAEFARVKVLVKRAAEGATVYLDDFSFTGPPAPTPTPTPTPTPSPTPSPSPSPAPTASPSPSPAPGPTASPTPSPAASPSPTAVPTATEVPPSATPSPSTATPTPTPSAGLVNGGFEEGDDEGKPLAWRKWGGELSRSKAATWEGQYAAAFTSRTASTKWAFQAVAVEGGEAYVLSGYALKNEANVEAAYLRLSWYASPDGSGTAIDSVDSTTRLTDDSPRFRLLSSGPVVAPAEAASAKVRLMLDPLSEAEATVYFDAISFSETTMPPQPVQTPQPSPTFASSESPTASAVVPTAPVEELEPSSSPAALQPRPSPAVLGATSGTPQATAVGLAGSSQSEAVSEGTPTRTPVVLYRERKTAQSSQGGESVAAGDEHDGLSPIVLILAMAAPAAAAAATAFFVWRRWRKRARPP